MHRLLVVFLFFLSAESFSQVKVWEEIISIPTYEPAAPDPNPAFFKGDLYQGASRVIYPYARRDIPRDEKKDKNYKALILENEYVRITVLPELGGKIYDAVDKTNGYHFFYRNNVIKPANIGMAGLWTSGGVEWDVVHHHRVSSFLPVDHFIQENEDGSRTIWIGETELRHRMRWIIGLTLFPGKSYVRAEIKIENRTPETNTFLYWANAAVIAGPGYRVIFPVSTELAVFHGMTSFAHWPLSHEVYNGINYSKGVDLSHWKNNPEPVSFFAYDLQDDFMGGYDEGKNAGLVHVGDHTIMKGAKLWEWGTGEQGKMWEKILTDKDGPYAELMTGAFSSNQPDYSWIRPGEVKSFTEYWYPVKDIGGFKKANSEAALNMELRPDGNLVYGACVTSANPGAAMRLYKDGRLIAEDRKNLDPAHPVLLTKKLPEGTLESTIRICLVTSGGKEILAWQSTAHDSLKPLPPVFVPSPSPESINTVEELFLTGQRIQQFHNPSFNPLAYMNRALQLDPMNAAANTWMGNEFYQHGEYETAAGYYRNAIHRLCYNYTIPDNCESLYGLGLCLQAMGQYSGALDTFGRAAWDYSWTAASTYRMSQIRTLQYEFQKAKVLIDRSLSANPTNNQAIALKSAILRHLGNAEQALPLIENAWNADPLDFWLGNEYVLCLRDLKREEEARNAAIDLEERMHRNNNSFLELADDYMQAGLSDEAGTVLRNLVKSNTGENIDPMVYYVLGFLAEEMDDSIRASAYFEAASASPADYCFPYIMSQEQVLKRAVRFNPRDAKAYYYLGNLLFDRQPVRAMDYWKKSVEIDSGFAIAFRNLGWGSRFINRDIRAAIHWYEKAIMAKPDDPVYYTELDQCYEENNSSIDQRLEMLQTHHSVLIQRNDALLREIRVHNLAGEPEKSVDYLMHNTFYAGEGEVGMHDINVDAHLLLGRKYQQRKNYNSAQKQFEEALEYPVNQQTARNPEDPRLPQIFYLMAQLAKQMGNKNKAGILFGKAAECPNSESSFDWYRGLAMTEMGQKSSADSLFQNMINQGEELLNQQDPGGSILKYNAFHIISGIQSRGYYLRGLGKLGMGLTIDGLEDLKKSLSLVNSNLWANEILKDYAH